MSNAETHALAMLGDLGPTVLPQLDNEAVRAYRRSYRMFRMGGSRGSSGEDPQAPPGAIIAEAFVPGVDEDAELLGLSFVDEHDSELFDSMSRFRMDYRQHRMGAARGAKGEITALATSSTSAMGSKRSSMMLPVGQLAALAAFRRVDKEAPAARFTTFHTHIGAGKLGLGLVIPAIHASGTPYAILQRPSSSWSAVTDKEGRKLGLRVNREIVIESMDILKNGMGGLGALPGGRLSKNSRVFVCTDEEESLAALIEHATTLSISLGPSMLGVVLPLLAGLKPRPEGLRPALYACENDHASVETLKEALQGRVDVVSCMVDRICTERKITEDWIEMGTEPSSGEIVVITPPPQAPLPPFEGNHVQIPRIPAEAEYFCRRKILMVNGMHTTLAFITLCKLEKGGLQGDAWKDHTLITPATATEDENAMVWRWAVARLMYVMWEHEPDMIKAAHGIDGDDEICRILLDYAKVTLGRFSGVEDKVGRVLGGGVANRFEGRLNMIKSFLENEPPMRGGLRARLLLLAGVREFDMRQAVRTLVDQSARFVGVKVEKPAAKVVVT
ncbi:unnamed protein product [Ascophyllum nodosum]